ncbi:hypothetical protein GH714_002107 [Hevea brasiliensis]|uniref:peroxidase n=1 Tax=Hevea brasiliensis TaxID=3981 RepID=A0A6A6KFU0_HEVBR|nr:hypothetical protein GH714_002107 [Hevea brasiliensis]
MTVSCMGVMLLFSLMANTEKTAGPNLLLRGYEVIDDAKTKLEAACPGVVSCADILALAARDSVVLTNGPSWPVPTGRRDGRVSLASDTANLPGFTDSVDVQKQKFAALGLNTQDLVTLVGTLPQNGDASKRIALDTGSSNTFDGSFFTNLRNGRGILESDQKLWTDTTTRTFVQRFLGIRGLLGLTFNVEFGRSMVKMSNIGVKTGANGEIRKVCSAIN